MSIIKKRISSRQKMINLMYILLMAMITLSTSSEINDAVVLGVEVAVEDKEKVMSDTIIRNDTIRDTVSVPVVEKVVVRMEENENGGRKTNGKSVASADLMNILYAGYDNPLTLSIPGLSASQVTLVMTNGKVRKLKDGKVIVRPDSVRTDAILSIYDRGRLIARHSFKVRELPEPMAYIVKADGKRQYGGAIARKDILSSSGVSAAIDNGMLDIAYTVLSFETIYFDSMGNGIMMMSEGKEFSERQCNAIKHLPRNRRLYITKVHVIDPNGKERILTKSTELIVK